jgi:hypothetical protein
MPKQSRHTLASQFEQTKGESPAHHSNSEEDDKVIILQFYSITTFPIFSMFETSKTSTRTRRRKGFIEQVRILSLEEETKKKRHELN